MSHADGTAVHSVKREDALEMPLELEDLRLEAVPHCCGQCGGDGKASGHHCQASGHAVADHPQIEPANEDEGHDVDHVEAVADAAIESQWPSAQSGIDRIALSSRGPQG